MQRAGASPCRAPVPGEKAGLRAGGQPGRPAEACPRACLPAYQRTTHNQHSQPFAGVQGAPYGYTPLCDGASDMDGFRFWQQGFWKDHLQGRPYHISALYVVDLDRFRRVGVVTVYIKPTPKDHTTMPYLL